MTNAIIWGAEKGALGIDVHLSEDGPVLSLSLEQARELRRCLDVALNIADEEQACRSDGYDGEEQS